MCLTAYFYILYTCILGCFVRRSYSWFFSESYNIWWHCCSTGQKYIYTGSHDGCVYIYDMVILVY